MRAAVYILVLMLGSPAFSAQSMLSSDKPEDLIRAIDAAKQEPLIELPWTIADLYIAAKKITEHPTCPSHEGLNSIFACLWQKLGNGSQMPEGPIAIANALLDNLRAEQVARQNEADSQKAREEEVADSAVLSSFHSELCAKGDAMLEQLNTKRAIETLSSGQKFLLNTFLELSLSNNKEEQRKAFCTTNKAALLLKARMQ